jgi:hypothetical protein
MDSGRVGELKRRTLAESASLEATDVSSGSFENGVCAPFS